MEDEKLAAYYDDLTRRGGGAARFKQGLGFSSNDSSTKDAVPPRGSALPSTSSFLSSFVKASSPSQTSQFEKEAQLQSIHNKLTRKPKDKIRSPRRDSSRRSGSPSPSRDRVRDEQSKRRSRSRSRSRDRHSRRRSRSRDRRSRRRSREDEHRRKSRSTDKNGDTSERKMSPERRVSEKSRKPREGPGRGGNDFANLIHGYEDMTPAERVKAKMKRQLSKTAENDEALGKGSGWERFEFNKDAPLDDEDEIEAAEDDLELVKHMGQSFRFSAVEARKEEDMKAAHDEAMFGAPSSYPAPIETDDAVVEKIHKTEGGESAPITTLLSDQVLTMQKGSWRDRARKQ